MDKNLNGLRKQIRDLEKELSRRVEEKRQQFEYSLHGKKVVFSDEIAALQKRFRQDTWNYLRTARPLALLTAPVIYGMALPLVLLDVSITLYQHICFRAYGIPLVRRDAYFIIDRNTLPYLNWIEKLNCVYCGYGNGLVSYAKEIIGRTEKHWCPIRHARSIPDPHSEYADFLEFGDADAYRTKLEQVRKDYSQE